MVNKRLLEANDWIAATGMPSAVPSYPSFTGTTIPDNSDIKESLQALETAVETKTTDTFSQAVSYTAGTARAPLKAFVSPGHNPYNAAEDGTTNDSTAFSGALAAKRNIMLSAGKSYSIKDITLTNSYSIIGNDAIINANTGATNIVSLQDFGPRLEGVYISSAENCSAAAIRLKAGRACRIQSVNIFNTGFGALDFTVTSPTTTSAARGNVQGLYAEGITNTGVKIGPSVSDWRFSDIFLDGKLVETAGLFKPTASSYGWNQDTPVTSGRAVGGHQITNMTVIDFDIGMRLDDAELTKFSNCISDSCSGYGVIIEGASRWIDFADMFVGTTRGIKVSGTANHIYFNGLRTILNGTIPSWGTSDFYNGVTTFYDMEVRDTAEVRVANWTGDKRIIVDATAKLIVDDGENFQGRSVGTVAAGSTVYLGYDDTATENDATWRAPYDCYLIRLVAYPTLAPGAGQTFTYTARVNAADTALVMTASGAADFGGTEQWAATHIAVSKGSTLSIKLVTSAGAAAARHQAIIQIVPR